MVGFDDTLLPDSVAVVLARPCDICGKQLKICSSSLRYSCRKLRGRTGSKVGQLYDAWRSSCENPTDAPKSNPQDHHGQGMTMMPILCNSLSLFFKRWNRFLNYCSEGGKIKIEFASTSSIPWKLPWGLHFVSIGFPCK